LKEEEEKKDNILTSVGCEAQPAGKYWFNPCNILIGSGPGCVPELRRLLVKESAVHIRK
jgi:hypothetical protein